MIGLAKEFAKANGLDQAQFSKMMGLFASHQLAEEAHFNAARKAEIDKLGPNVATRVDSVNMWLRSMVGDQLAGAIRQSMVTADQVRAIETLISKWTSQGVSGNPAAGRDGTDAGRGPQRVDDATYAKMSYTEKAQYAAQFDQSQYR
jgi:hypothetical protein